MKPAISSLMTERGIGDRNVRVDIDTYSEASMTQAPHPKAQDTGHQLAPLTLRTAQLAAVLGVCLSQIHKLRNHPDPAVRLPAPIKVGRMSMWRMTDVQDWLHRQSEAACDQA